MNGQETDSFIAKNQRFISSQSQRSTQQISLLVCVFEKKRRANRLDFLRPKKGVFGKQRPRKRRPKTSKTKTSKTKTSKAKTTKTKTSKTKTTKTKTSKTKTSKTIPHIHRYTEETVAESKLFNVDMSSGQFIEQKYFSNPFSGDRDDRIFKDRDDRIIFGTLFQNL